jgi:hypothetical protein
LTDALAEVQDTAATLEAEGSDGTSGGVPAVAPLLPAALLEHRYNKEKTERENTLKEKELLQKQLDFHKCPVGAGKGNPWRRCANNRSAPPRRYASNSFFY